MKSRTNFARRQRSIEERLDPSWQPERTRPVLEGGNLHYEVSGRTQAISGGGLGLMQSVVEAVGRDPVDLIETVAERVAGVALAYPAVEEVEVTVHKPEAPIAVPFDDVAVTIVRSRA